MVSTPHLPSSWRKQAEWSILRIYLVVGDKRLYGLYSAFTQYLEKTDCMVYTPHLARFWRKQAVWSILGTYPEVGENRLYGLYSAFTQYLEKTGCMVYTPHLPRSWRKQAVWSILGTYPEVGENRLYGLYSAASTICFSLRRRQCILINRMAITSNAPTIPQTNTGTFHRSSDLYTSS